MLKISTIDAPTERRLLVEGKLIHPWVAELRTAWRIASENLDGRALVIDLSNVTTIGEEGESALFELMMEGARFSCGGVLTRYLLNQLEYRCRTGRALQTGE